MDSGETLKAASTLSRWKLDQIWVKLKALVTESSYLSSTHVSLNSTLTAVSFSAD